MAQAFYNLGVSDTRRVSPSMHQVTLAGDDLLSFPEGQAGGYFKLILEPGDDVEQSGAVGLVEAVEGLVQEDEVTANFKGERKVEAVAFTAGEDSRAGAV